MVRVEVAEADIRGRIGQNGVRNSEMGLRSGMIKHRHPGIRNHETRSPQHSLAQRQYRGCGFQAREVGRPPLPVANPPVALPVSAVESSQFLTPRHWLTLSGIPLYHRTRAAPISATGVPFIVPVITLVACVAWVGDAGAILVQRRGGTPTSGG
jgi:hypothetical protein